MTSAESQKYPSLPNLSLKKVNSPLGYLPQLDGLRVLAVGMVMVGHWVQWKWTHPALVALPLIHGVTLFFVLSGFLITRILLNENQIRQQTNKGARSFMVRFYLRRTLRIFPLYYGIIFFLFAINHPMAKELFPWLLTYSTNIYQSIHNVYVGDFNHFWSLGVEEQFYLFWPWLFLIFPKSKRLLFAMIGIAILGILLRIFLAVYVGKWMATSYFTLACMPMLALGGILAWIQRYSPSLLSKINHPMGLPLVFLFYLMGLFAYNRWGWIWYKEMVDEYFFAILAFFIIAKASENGFSGWIGQLLNKRWIQYTGQISYGLYVFHLFVPSFCTAIFSRLGFKLPEFAMLIVFFLLTFGLAHFSWIFMEHPINRWKQKLPYLNS